MSISIHEYLPEGALQIPDEGVFDFNDLKWKAQSYGGKDHCLAFIPSCRINDFIQGECKRGVTSFVKNDNRRTQSNHTIHWWCDRGPQDFRGCEMNPSRDQAEGSRRKRRAKGESNKRGCQCNFKIKIPFACPDAAEIRYYCHNHEDVNGVTCHGEEEVNATPMSRLASHLSKEKIEWIRYMLRLKYTPSQIMEIHQEEVIEFVGNIERDHLITMDDIHNQQRHVSSAKEKLHNNEFKSTIMWGEQNAQDVIYLEANGDLFSMMVSTNTQKEWCLKYANNGTIAMDATFGTNHNRFYLFTLLVFDEFGNGLPVAWTITNSTTGHNIHTWLNAFDSTMTDVNPDWRPSSFIIDDADCEINAIRMVWHDMNILLCIWHVRRAWLKNIISKVKDPEHRRAIFIGLGNVMYNSNQNVALNLLTDLEAKFRDEFAFWNYFHRIWGNKVNMWLLSARSFPHANHETNSSIEAYHSVIKGKAKQKKNQLRGRRIDWLLHFMMNNVLTHYKYNVLLKHIGVVRNERCERRITNAVFAARDIPDDDVQIQNEENTAFVRSRDGTTFYRLSYIKDGHCFCECPDGMRGNICKHQIKVMKMLQNVSDAYIVRVHGTEYGRDFVDEEYYAQDIHQHFSPQRHMQNSPERHMQNSPERRRHSSVHIGDIPHDEFDEYRTRWDHLGKEFETICEIADEGGIDALRHGDNLITASREKFQETMASRARGFDRSISTNAFRRVEDGKGNTLRRGKSFLEKITSKFRKKK